MLDKTVKYEIEEGTGFLLLSGYALGFEPYPVYGTVSEGGWTERIEKFAIEKALAVDANQALARDAIALTWSFKRCFGVTTRRSLSGGLLTLTIDEIGLRVDARVPPHTLPIPDNHEWCISFRVKNSLWSMDDTYREISDLLIGEVSILPIPAAPAIPPDNSMSLERQILKANVDLRKAITRAQRHLVKIVDSDDEHQLAAEQQLAACRRISDCMIEMVQAPATDRRPWNHYQNLLKQEMS